MKVSIRLVSSKLTDARHVAKRGGKIVDGMIGDLHGKEPTVGLCLLVVDGTHSTTHNYVYRTSVVKKVEPILHGWTVTTQNSVYRVIRKKTTSCKTT